MGIFKKEFKQSSESSPERIVLFNAFFYFLNSECKLNGIDPIKFRGAKMLKKLVFSLMVIPCLIFAQNKIYLGHIETEISLGMGPYVKRVITEAEKNGAAAVIFRINTFGGRVDAATQIKDEILNSRIPTIAFIDKRAISAGSLISLSCQKIIMTPGSTIGATTVVDQTGKKQSEKYQSFMRSEMRAVAEKNNRPVNIAQGMVDERIVVPGLVDSTQLITLTADEALQYGIADTILPDLASALKYLQLKNATIIDKKMNWSEKVVQFLNNPFVTSLLLMIGMVGLFFEIKTPGWGVAGTSAVIALALFFGSNYIVELASTTEILLFVIGVILLLLEVFVIPGFGIVGVSGILLIVVSLFMSMIPSIPIFGLSSVSGAIFKLAGSFVLSGILIFFLSKFLPKTAVWNRMILDKEVSFSTGYTSDEKIASLVGKQGKALSDLRPAGIAMIGNKRVDVVTEGDYIKAGSKIIVTNAEGSKVIVRKV